MKTLICVLALIVISKSLPIRDLEDNKVVVATTDFHSDDTVNIVDSIPTSDDSENNKTVISRNAIRNSIRPGLVVTRYAITLEPNGGTFNGMAEIDVNILDLSTREDDIVFHVEDLNIQSVSFRIGGGSILFDADFDVDDGLLSIETGRIASLYTFVIEYTGSMELAGMGFYAGLYPGNNYVGMNLHPTNARRVFPCMDEPTEAATISFTFNNLNYNNIVSNSLIEENTQYQFRALMGPPHVWGMVAHNFESILFPTQGVQVYGRSGLTTNDAMATAINFIFNNLNTWYNKNYFEIDVNQDGRLVILALPDVDVEWNSLSTVGIWEPYMVMEVQQHSVKQRSAALVKVAEAISRQWFGYVVYPENWKHQWVVAGLGSYAAWEMLREFQAPTGTATDMSLLDINTLFVTEVIQTSLFQDASRGAWVLEPDDDIFDEETIRNHISSVKLKATALLRMLRLMLGGDDNDYVQVACQSLLNARSLQTVNSINFFDAVNSEFGGNDFVDDIEDYMEQWIKNTGYPSIFVSFRSGGLVITQQRFGFTSQPEITFDLPLTYTTSINPDFDNVYPEFMITNTHIIDIFLDDDDWVLFNIQGQGYYRVNYADDLWERITEALNDPDQREVIHPLNRGTLVDDSLNLARANRLGYDVAFPVVLTMEHETEYAPWRAFVRNMDFLRKRLEALVAEDEDLDQDIYLRMVRRTIGRVEEDLGFSPDPLISEPMMTSLTRGLVMDHACRAGYQPCIAAAVDWFYDTSASEPTVNPNIPHDIRPAVYCTMVREGDNAVIEALERRLEIEPTQYERVVILESLGCSRDMDYINTLLETTIAANSPYLVEERSRILASVIQSGYDAVLVALNFMNRRTNEIRQMYGGPQKLEKMIFLLADNMANDVLATEFNNWRSDRNNNLEDSQDAADRAYDIVQENLNWNTRNLETVYEWIDENDAPTLAISLVLLCVTAFVTIFNH